jgi:hypothetical protein
MLLQKQEVRKSELGSDLTGSSKQISSFGNPGDQDVSIKWSTPFQEASSKESFMQLFLADAYGGFY